MRVTKTAFRALWRLWMAALLAGAAVLPAHAQLKVEVTKGVSNPIPIAIVTFARAAPVDGGLDVAGVVQHDLAGSGRFRTLSGPRLPTTAPTTGPMMWLPRTGRPPARTMSWSVA